MSICNECGVDHLDHLGLSGTCERLQKAIECIKFYATNIKITDVVENSDIISYTKQHTYDGGKKARELLGEIKGE